MAGLAVCFCVDFIVDPLFYTVIEREKRGAPFMEVHHFPSHSFGSSIRRLFAFFSTHGGHPCQFQPTVSSIFSSRLADLSTLGAPGSRILDARVFRFRWPSRHAAH